jgi:hypothetical protein
MVVNKVAARLELLWESLVAETPNELMNDGNEVSDIVLQQYQIDRVHLESYCSENEAQQNTVADIYGPQTLFPLACVPILFEPMSRSELEKYPILASGQPRMRDYDPAIAGDLPNDQKGFIYTWGYHLLKWVSYSMSGCGVRENTKTLDERLHRRRKLKNIQ